MNLGLVIAGLVIAIIFLPLAVYSSSYEEIQSIPGGYRVITVQPAFQALFWLAAIVGLIIFFIGLATASSTERTRHADFTLYQQPPPGTRIYCPHCGARTVGTPFCPYCGRKTRG